MSDALTQMIQALGLEVAVIQRRGRGSQIQLRGGERIGQTGDNWLYRFPVAEDLSLRDDTPVRLTSRNKQTPGELVSFRDGALVVAVKADLGTRIASAKLTTDDSFLVEQLKVSLEKVHAGQASFNKEGAERVIGEASARTGYSEPDSVVLQGDRSLNEEQQAAIRHSLGSETTFVWGPPGTGKTTTLARIVESHYRAGRSVLLVSNTNIAVDTALEKVAERLKGEPEFYQGAVLRRGPVVKEELRQQFGPQVILDEAVARLGDALHREREDLRRQVAALVCEERPLIQAVTDHERLDKLACILSGAHTSLAGTRRSIQAREAEAEQQRSRAAALRNDLKRARTMSKLRRLFSGLDPERLERETAATERAGQSARDAARALVEESKRREARVCRLREEVERLAQSVQAYPALADCRRRLETIREKLNPARERIAAIDRELAALRNEVLGRCRILATTVYRTYSGNQKTRNFDVVVIDEASMLMLPLAYYAAGLASHAVVVAGDFRQLSAIVASDGRAADEWLKRDVFEKAGIPDKLRRGSATPELVALKVQYRMREPICRLVNQFFYTDHPLSTDASVGRTSTTFPFGDDAPLLYVDTSPFHPWAARPLGSVSRYNVFHALLVRNIILHLADVGYLRGAGVGAVSPYRAQSKLIRALLEDRLETGAAGMAATVHRFQGNEKDAILLDLTDSYGANLSRFLKACRPDDSGARMLNVAVSRARHNIVLIANFQYLSKGASDRTIVRRLTNYFAAHGRALDVEALLPLVDRDWVDALHDIVPLGFELPEGGAGAFTEGTFYPAFAQDLLRAKSSIVIFSPFATRARTSRWVDHVRGALARGATVRVVTRPPGQGGAPADEVQEIIAELRAIGVVVDLRAGMHQKIAILDGRVLWHGSLNVLSHRDTHESMLRIESSVACETLGRF